MQGALVDQRTDLLLGRYAIFDEIASGGMATVHLGRLLGPVGFSKVVAIKRLHPQFAKDPEFSTMFIDEARLAARIQHPNVVATLDVVPLEGEIFLVLDYVSGEPLSRLIKATAARGAGVDPRIAASVVVGVLHGLHAAHQASDELGRQLGIVHRDISPQNVMVGADGVARVLDFGVAKAAGRLQSTRDGQLKGKLSYMAPEQVHGVDVDARTDIYSAGVVLWESLTLRRMISGNNEANVLAAVLQARPPPPSKFNPAVPPAVDQVVLRALEKNPADRFPTAREMAIALERAAGVASAYEVGEWVRSVANEALALRAARVKEMESTSAVRLVPPTLEAWERSGSSVSTVQAPPPAPVLAPPPPRSNLPLVLVTVLVTALLGVVGLVLVLSLRSRPEPAAAPPAELGSAMDRAPPAPSALPAPVAAEPSATAAPATEPEPTSVAIEQLSPEPVPVAAPKPWPPSTKAPAAKPNCASPFFVDKNGIKHPKPECL
jgi:eukaryotic-like serine/threonine-protein kinase